MMRSLAVALLSTTGLLLAGCTPRVSTGAPAVVVPKAALPATHSEQTDYRETSSHANVLAFLENLSRLGAPLVIDTLAMSPNGRLVPLVIASKPRVRTVEEARALKRPIVYIQANIHAGEVEGKEAILALLRDWSFAAKPTVLDSLVLVVIPIYNADGNEKLAPQARNRGAQNGPEMIGERPNGMGLDLNRDFVKAEAPETRGALAAFTRWAPDVYMDLHTTNGSYHGYALTYSPSLHPAAPLAPFTADTLLPEIRRRMKARHGFEVFPYGNFASADGRESITASEKSGWWTYEHKARYGTNYYGLRGGISILSEAYSHDPFDRRVASTRAFVQEILSYLAEQRTAVLARVAAGRAAATFGAGTTSPVAVRGRFTSRPDTQLVLVERLERLRDSSAVTQPGVPRGIRRTGEITAQRMPVVDRFEPALTRQPSPYGYLLPAEWTAAVALLKAHGVPVITLAAETVLPVQQFRIDSVVAAGRAFQGHREMRVEGRWVDTSITIPAGTIVVRTGAPTDLVAMQLLEPESDDGLLTWNVFDRALAVGAMAPVARLRAPLR